MKLVPILPAAVLACLLAAPAAHAQLDLTFTPPARVAAPGSTFTFTGTLANNSGSTVFLNGDSLSLNGPGLTSDDSPFLSNAPLSLANGDSYSGDFFSVSVDPATPAGTYFGTFAVTGGADGSAQDTVASQDFSVQVTSGSAPVPEASSVASLGLLLALGLGGVAVARRRKAA